MGSAEYCKHIGGAGEHMDTAALQELARPGERRVLGQRARDEQRAVQTPTLGGLVPGPGFFRSLDDDRGSGE